MLQHAIRVLSSERLVFVRGLVCLVAAVDCKSLLVDVGHGGRLSHGWIRFSRFYMLLSGESGASQLAQPKGDCQAQVPRT